MSRPEPLHPAPAARNLRAVCGSPVKVIACIEGPALVKRIWPSNSGPIPTKHACARDISDSIHVTA